LGQSESTQQIGGASISSISLNFCSRLLTTISTVPPKEFFIFNRLKVVWVLILIFLFFPWAI
jgi:hypothetical protein